MADLVVLHFTFTNTGQLPLGISSVHIVISICLSSGFLNEFLFGEVARVLKPGGSFLVYKKSQSTVSLVSNVISNLGIFPVSQVPITF